VRAACPTLFIPLDLITLITIGKPPRHVISYIPCYLLGWRVPLRSLFRNLLNL